MGKLEPRCLEDLEAVLESDESIVHGGPIIDTQALLDECTHVKVSGEARAAAHAELDAWFADCEAQAPQSFHTGHFGPVGKFTVKARVDDDEVGLTLRRSIERDVP